MKCPKCGYTSFDYLDACRKCGVDLGDHKGRFGVRSLLFPAAPEPAAEAPATPEAAATPEEALATEARDATDFGFDFLDGEETPAGDAAPQSADSGAEEPPAAGAPQDDAELPEPRAAATHLAPAGEEIRADLEEDDEFAFPGFDEEDDFFSKEEEPSAAGDDLFAEADPFAPVDGEEEPRKKAAPPEGPDPFESGGSAAAGRSPRFPDDGGPAAGPDPLPWPDPAAVSWTLPAGETVTPLGGGPLPDPAPARPAAEPPTAAPAAGAAEGESPALAPSAGDAAGTEEAPQEPSDEAPPAPLIARLAASLADLLVLAVLFGLFLVVGKSLLHPGDGLLPSPATLLALSTPYFLLLFVTCFAYFTLFHLLLGQTPGKMLFGLGIESAHGGPLAPGQAFLRSVGGLAALTVAGLGFLPSLFDGYGRGWNDRLADTRVVVWREDKGRQKA